MPDDQRQPGPPKEGLSVEFLTVEELYAGSYTFNLPWFQRAYAWTENLAQRLLNDICQAYADGARRYFIGHVLLARKAGESRHMLVDGQQRAVTLMIVFALLRHKLAGTPWENRLTPLIEAGPGQGYRLLAQPAMEQFFHEHVQSPGAMARPIDDYAVSEVERNVLTNRARLDEKLEEFRTDGGNLAQLAEFLLTRCLLVVEIVDSESENEAWRMLQTEENTGLPFHDGSLTKVTLIEAMPPQDREMAGKLWDRCQAKLGDDGMQRLMSHIRDLSGRQRSSQPVEKDLLTRFPLQKRGLACMRDVFVPAADRLARLRSHDIGTDPECQQIARYLRHMEWAGHDCWCPAGMRWLEKYGAEHSDAVEFFRLLARKVWLLRISGADAVEHERRFIMVANEIADSLAVAEMIELHATERLLLKARQNLLSRTFYDKRYSRPVLRFLSDLRGTDPGEIDGDRVTVEHVLPRNPDPRSRWTKDFGSPREIANYAHRIGNLALLSFKDNQFAGNREYADKRLVLKQSGFALSTDVAANETWTPDHILARSNALVRTLFDHWRVPF
ncbi:MAG: DUF262 domain-containing HNH endonuclease family protein [Alphaproteobacteria bacterium]|nr:DUF262 domain-containing HNH endonuclease family protein [Alphaproteobacteria bacterium]